MFYDLGFAVALKIKKANEVDVHDAGAGGRRDDGRCVIGDAETRALDHVEVVRAVADRECVVG